MAAKVTITIGSIAPSDIEVGGWAAVLSCGEHKKEIYGHEQCSSSNRMSISAAINAVTALKKMPSDVVIKTSSAYLADNYARTRSWAANAWRTTTGTEVKEKDLWQRLRQVSAERGITLKVERCEPTENVRSRNLAKAAAYSSLFE